ncbi:AMP-binding protein [Azospirillum halopraeferens]|uniref:AMP-binding protein n=1 Tax=Azospirillum halopraeferens TaxID=34010 RepID=UPI00041EE94E|nr:AMP-binding protein [Azospirillum halopraeferens]
MADSGTLPRVPASVVHMLAEAADSHAQSPAVTFGDTTLTYAALLRAVAGLALQWRDVVGAGERIALVMGNSLDLVVATYAAHAAGAQVVPLNPSYTAREIGAMLEDARPRLVVYDAGVAADVHGFCAALGVAAVVCAGSSGTALAMEHAAGSARLPAELPGHDDLATLQYTGGTTGRSKGVNILHRQLAVNLAQREAVLPTERGGEVALCSMPLFHVSAVSMCLHLACYAASHLVVLPRYRPDRVIEAIARHRVTLMSAGPTIFRGLLAHDRLGATDLASLRYCYSGSAPLPEATLRGWEEATGGTILEGYGMTEAGPVLSYNPVHGARKVGSVGPAVPCSEMQIVDADDGTRRLGRGETGEIRVRGPHVMAGYRNRPDADAEALRDGWLYTGDIGHLDGDGYLFITGRKKETINVGGYKVYPREVEEVLFEHPAVQDAAVFGAPDGYYGQVVHAYVVPRDGMAVRPAELVEHCRRGLVRYKVPRAIALTDALPKTSVGKLARRLLVPIPEDGESVRAD